MLIVNKVVEVTTSGSSTSVTGSPCRGAMDLEVTHGSPNVGITPRKGTGRVWRIPLSESNERGDRDNGNESHPQLGMDSVGDHRKHLPASFIKAIVVVMEAILSHLWNVLKNKFRA